MLRYAIKTARAIFTNAGPWPAIEDFLLLAYRKNPSVLPSAIEILVNRQKTKGDVDLKKIAHFIGSNIRRLSETEKHGELVWLLFLASELSIQLSASLFEVLFHLNCPMSAMHVCHLHSQGLIKKPIDRSVWNLSLSAEGLTSEMWLYAYEASLKGWTGKPSSKWIVEDKAFGPLWDGKVSFFDIAGHVANVGDSSKKDMALSLKLKSALSGDASFFDFDDEEDVPEDWSEY